MTDTLKLLARHTTDPALKDQIDDVLSGKAGVREFARGEVFSRTLDRVMPAALDEYSAMSEEERRLLAEEGEAQLDRYRDSAATSEPQPSTAAPEPVQPAPAAPPVDEPGRTTSARTIPGTRKPDREKIVTPEEPDDDDLFFEQRNRHGWLE